MDYKRPKPAPPRHPPTSIHECATCYGAIIEMTMKQEKKKKAQNWIKSNRLELIPSDGSHFKPLKYVFTMRNDSTFPFLDFPTTAGHRTRVLSGPSLPIQKAKRRLQFESVSLSNALYLRSPESSTTPLHAFTLVRNMENGRNAMRARSERQRRRNLAVRKIKGIDHLRPSLLLCRRFPAGYFSLRV